MALGKLRRPVATIKDFLDHEAASGLILMAAAVLALVLNNSPLTWLYDALLTTPVVVQVGELAIDKALLLWINDGLMAIFFLLVGLEIKREVMEGELSSPAQIALPAVAAVGGMLLPALIYAAVNYDDPLRLGGWAIPAATDIAFALGVLGLLGKRVPSALKVLLLAVAIIDDLGAIVIIALFYTSNLSLTALGLAALGLVALAALNLAGVRKITPYMLVGVFLWVCVLKSGVHATLAGVAVALAIPLTGGAEEEESPPLKHLEHALHPWVAYAIMPIFAFANAGVSLAGFGLERLLEPVPLGIALGLFLGKQAGVFGFVFLGCKLGLCRLPGGIGWLQLYGLAVLTGIGFTMSLFIGTLAFDDPSYAAGVRLGVLGGSLLSAVVGYLILLGVNRDTARAAA